ncbi:MAG: hypothetical protein ACLP01_25490 [Solirubrobacteraceae bacterium]
MQAAPTYEFDAFAAAVASLHARAGRWSLSADDIQQAALELWGSAPQREPGACSQMMLLMRARSRSVDALRTAARRSTAPLEASYCVVARDQVAGCDEHCHAIDAARWADRVETQLPPEHAVGWRAWRLRVEVGLDSSEIAEHLGNSPKAMRQRVSRCARWVREHVPAESPTALSRVS